MPRITQGQWQRLHERLDRMERENQETRWMLGDYVERLAALTGHTLEKVPAKPPGVRFVRRVPSQPME